MAYPKKVKERATELSKLYGSADKVLAALEEEFPGEVPFNERTIRRWCKADDKRRIKTREEHFEHLLGIVNLLLENEVDKAFGIPSEGDNPEADDYTIIGGESDYEKIRRGYLVERIENNIDNAIKTYNMWDFWECFVPHFMADVHRHQSFREFYENHTIEFVDTLRMLAQRKTFKGTCPICKDW